MTCHEFEMVIRAMIIAVVAGIINTIMKYSLYKTITVVLTIVTVIFLSLLLSARLDLGLLRYFDADELAYLHWAHNVFSGKIPYIDFFFYVPPGFLWFLAPLFLFAKGSAILPLARVTAFIIFLLLGAVSGLILRQIRKPKNVLESLWVLMLPACALVFLPLPADKMLEMRPDTIATVMAFIGLYLQVRWIENQNKTFAWWSGVAYGVSLLLLPKSLPQVAVACIVAVFASLSLSKRFVQLGMFLLGIGLPLCMFGLWILVSSRSVSDLQLVLYSLTSLPMEVNKIGQLFPMQPDLFFYPNNNYYGMGGWSRGLIANHIVWIMGLLFGVWRLLTPWIGGKNKAGAWVEVLIGGSMLAYIVTFIYGYPLRHAQYLIPIAAFVAFYVGDMIWLIWSNLYNNSWKTIFVIGYVFSLVLLWGISVEVNNPKRLWTNKEDIQTLEFALRTIPKDSYVLDLVGATIYFRDPSYGCCLPLGQYSPFLTRPVNVLKKGLERTNPMYVYQGRLYRLNDVTLLDRQYVEAKYRPLSADKIWFVRK